MFHSNDFLGKRWALPCHHHFRYLVGRVGNLKGWLRSSKKVKEIQLSQILIIFCLVWLILAWYDLFSLVCHGLTRS